MFTFLPTAPAGRDTGRQPRPSSFKTMKLMVVLIMLFCVQASAIATAQTVTMSGQQLSFKEIFSRLEKQTGYLVFYNTALLNNTKPVSVNAKDVSIETFLRTIMADQPIDFEISSRTITIKAKPLNARTPATSQDPPVKGKVTDDQGNALPGATVSVSGTSRGVQTNEKGEFTIDANDKDILVVSYIGFDKKMVSVGGAASPLVVKLAASKKNMNEVVVIGYGSVKKSDLTGAVSTVKVADLENVPAPRIDQMLAGRIAGAEFVSTDGEPGSGTSVRIRGTRSISASNEPLYIVDGLMDAIKSLNEINPSDVATITVLKDASSTAIYGSRGSNGVIIITTKSGVDRNGKTNFTFHTDHGYSELPRYLDIMNATEFAQMQNDRFYFAATANQTKPLEEYPFPDPLAMGEGTNWTDEITRRAPYSNYVLSATGGDKATQYYFSANYNDNEGIIMNSGMKRYQVRLNLDRTISKFVKAGIRFNYSNTKRALNKADVGTNTLWYRSTLFLAPTIAAYKPDGSFNDWNTQWYTGTQFDSPLANVLLRRNDRIEKSLSSMLYLEIKPFPNTSIRSTISYSDYNLNDDAFTPSTMPTRTKNNTGAAATKRAYTDNNILNENTITYKKTFAKDHNFDAMYGFTIQKKNFVNFQASGSGYFVDAIETNDLAAVPTKDNLSLSSSFEDLARMSHLARVNYNYANKYYFTATMRADGASNFSANNKWAYFPSAAFRWNVMNEDFMKRYKNMDEFAIRVSAGTSGNDAISRYQSLARLTSTTGGYIFGGTQPVAYYPSRIGNEGLTWEKTSTVNIGADLSFFNKRLNIVLDAYQSNTSDLLLTVQLPTQVGYDSRLANVGKTSNKGIELTIDYENVRTRNFNWSTTYTFAHNTQMVEDIGGLDRIATFNNNQGAQYMMYGYEKGRPLNALYGMQYAGVWKNQAEIDKGKVDKQWASISGAYYTPGRQRYIDQNHDGLLDNQDLVYLGNADPILYGGIQNSFRYKKLFFSFYFNYSIGGDIYNPVELFMGTGTYLSNQFRYMVNAWHPIRNPNSDIPRADSKDDIPNDRFIHDASFLRLKAVSLGYSFDLARITNNSLKSVALTLSGNNLLLWKYYNGYDPEVSTQSDGSTIRRMDNGAYPNSRTVTFGAEIKF